MEKKTQGENFGVNVVQWENVMYHHITFERLCVGRDIDCFLDVKHHNFCQTADRDAVIRNLKAGAAGGLKITNYNQLQL